MRFTAIRTSALLALLTGTAACGASSTSTPSPHASSSSNSSSASPNTSNAAAALALTVDELPTSSAGTLTQINDSLLSGTSNTDQRAFANGDRSFVIETDVVVEASATATGNDYGQVRDAAKGRVSNLANSTSPSIGETANEYVGTTSDSKSIVAISFRRGLTVDAVLIEASGGSTVDPNYVESVALALDQKIQNHS